MDNVDLVCINAYDMNLTAYLYIIGVSSIYPQRYKQNM